MKKFILIFTMLLSSICSFGADEKELKVGDQFPNVTFIKPVLEKSHENSSFIQDFKNLFSGKNEKKEVEPKEISIADLKGKPVLINFTASWCPFCKEEKAKFNGDYEKFLKDNKDIQTIVVFGDYGKESPETAAQYMRENGYSFPYYYDAGRVILKEINLKKIPLNYLLDENGKIMAIETYYHDIPALKAHLSK